MLFGYELWSILQYSGVLFVTRINLSTSTYRTYMVIGKIYRGTIRGIQNMLDQYYRSGSIWIRIIKQLNPDLTIDLNRIKEN